MNVENPKRQGKIGHALTIRKKKKVTAQGTVAGLLLSQVYPFEPPPGYYCRGYKSQVSSR